MDRESQVMCFECGQRVQDPPVVHELPDGESCTSCKDRALASLPPLFPTRAVWDPRPEQESVQAEAEAEGEADSES